MKQPEDVVWDAITESAKGRFDFPEFAAAYRDFDNENLAENILFLIIFGFSKGHSINTIADEINRKLLVVGFRFEDESLQAFLKDKEKVLAQEIRATKNALIQLDQGWKIPGVLVQVKSTLKALPENQNIGPSRTQHIQTSTQIQPAEFQRYAEELFRRAIASNLEIPSHVLLESPDKQTIVEHCLSSVITIATQPTLEAAATHFVATKVADGKVIALADAQKHIEAVYDQFPLLIAGVERMLEMGRQSIESQAIWDFLRCRVLIAPEYDDEWMQVADASILHGERHLLDLGTGNVNFRHIFPDNQT